jgi:poly(A) polymerase
VSNGIKVETVTERSLSLKALRWACDVGTSHPDLLERAPERPEVEELRALSVAQVREYVDRLLLGQYVQQGLDALLRIGVLEAWLPEAYALVGFGDGEWQHKDVWKHSKQVVWQSSPRLPVRWAALLHDIGKVKTRSIEPDGEVHFFGHSELGAALFRKQIARRLGFGEALRERIRFLILHHLRASQYDSSWTDSAVRRFIRETGDALEDLLDLSRADITTKRPGRRQEGLRLIGELASRIDEVKIDDSRVPPLPSGVGNQIMEHFKLAPSRKIGDVKRRLEQEVEAGALESGREPEYYLTWLDARRQELGLE